MPRPNTMEDFWRNVDVRGDDECWEWQGCRDRRGYGKFRLGNRKQHLTHRVAFSTVQHVPDDMLVCHVCDNPPCCNPAHLFLGTHPDNMRDMKEKGRAKSGDVKGERHGCSKLIECEVHFIKHSDIKQHELARIFGVNQATISFIKSGKIWGHVA